MKSPIEKIKKIIEEAGGKVSFFRSNACEFTLFVNEQGEIDLDLPLVPPPIKGIDIQESWGVPCQEICGCEGKILQALIFDGNKRLRERVGESDWFFGLTRDLFVINPESGLLTVRREKKGFLWGIFKETKGEEFTGIFGPSSRKEPVRLMGVMTEDEAMNVFDLQS